MSQDLTDLIPVIEPPAQAAPVETVDPKDDLADLRIRTQNHTLKTLEHELDEAKTMGTWRLVFALAIFLFCLAWMGFIGKYLCWFGQITTAPTCCDPKPISDAVMIALITTTTINVLGLFYIVARWLFPQKNGAVAGDPKI